MMISCRNNPKKYKLKERWPPTAGCITNAASNPGLFANGATEEQRKNATHSAYGSLPAHTDMGLRYSLRGAQEKLVPTDSIRSHHTGRVLLHSPFRDIDWILRTRLYLCNKNLRHESNKKKGLHSIVPKLVLFRYPYVDR